MTESSRATTYSWIPSLYLWKIIPIRLVDKIYRYKVIMVALEFSFYAWCRWSAKRPLIWILPNKSLDPLTKPSQRKQGLYHPVIAWKLVNLKGHKALFSASCHYHLEWLLLTGSVGEIWRWLKCHTTHGTKRLNTELYLRVHAKRDLHRMQINSTATGGGTKIDHHHQQHTP